MFLSNDEVKIAVGNCQKTKSKDFNAKKSRNDYFFF